MLIRILVLPKCEHKIDISKYKLVSCLFQRVQHSMYYVYYYYYDSRPLPRILTKLRIIKCRQYDMQTPQKVGHCFTKFLSVLLLLIAVIFTQLRKRTRGFRGCREARKVQQSQHLHQMVRKKCFFSLIVIKKNLTIKVISYYRQNIHFCNHLINV